MSTNTTPPNGMVSNVEKILRSTLGEEMDLTGIPVSRVEYYLMQLKDMIERLATGAVRPMGETTTPLTDGATTNPITIDGESYTAQANDIVFYGNKEFLFVNSSWREIGDLTNLTADMVDDTNTTNKFVTAGEKQTWNSKQSTIDSSHKLSADLVDDSDATNKFATAAQLDQIGTNQTAIGGQQNTTASGGNGYALINGIRLYVSSTAPTGNIPDGSVGVGW